MIPRKRLQVLLYILQIFYVIGDGDPGGEGFLVNELPDNVIDDADFATKLPLVHHSIHERIPSAEDAQASNVDEEMYGSNNRAKEDESLISRDNGIAVEESDLKYLSDVPTNITNLTVSDVQSTSLNISWSIEGENAAEYEISVYMNDELVVDYNTTNLNYSITDLEPCGNYRIGVSPVPSNENNTQFVNVTTSSDDPGQPVNLELSPMKHARLKVDWQIPDFAGLCVSEYEITIDTMSHENRHSQSKRTSNKSVLFDNVHACTSYFVTVTSINQNNESTESVSNYSAPTLPELAIPPTLNESDSQSIKVTKDSATLIWHVASKANNCSLQSVFCDCHFDATQGYGFEYIHGNATVFLTPEQRPKNLTVTVKKLNPYSGYVCRAQSINEAGASNWSLPIIINTTEDVSSAPQNFQNAGRDQNSRLLFIWDKPKYMPGKLQNYRINFTWTPRHPVPDWCELNRTFVVSNLDNELTKYTLNDEETFSYYHAKISARTGAGWSPEVMITFDSTPSGGVPDAVTNLTCTIKNQLEDPNALETELSWGLPCSLRGELHYFNVSYVGTRAGYENHTYTHTVNVTTNPEKNHIFSISLGELRPAYTYTFEVFSVLYGFIDDADIADLVVQYPAGIPPQPDNEYVRSITLDPHKARRSTSSAAILLPLFPPENGEVKYYAVMVSGVLSDNSTSMARFNIKEGKWPDVPSWEEAMERDFRIPYQATEPLWSPFPNYVVDYGHMKAVKFVVGEDTTCPEVSSNTKTRVYCNGPLKPDTWYDVRMRAFTDNGYSDSAPFRIKTNAELNVGLVLGVVFGILFIGILTTLMLLVKRCSIRMLAQRVLQTNITESPVPNPFNRRKFMSHCQQLAENPGKLSNEFQLLQTLSVDLQMPSNAACLQANRKKNRYSDILPYDFSRVKLEIIDNDPNSDYINASYVRGYSGNEEYIACQGPKEDTTYDFWRMIDQYDVKMILMLTQLVERGKEKCHQYYPTIRETFTYENLSIRCTSELDYRTFTQRTLVLQKEDNKRTITHLHFKDWPDHDVPDDFDAMIHFCQIFRKQLTSVKGLAVIHCSAGIGRTGTLIAIDILLQCIRDNRKLDVFGTVYRLRRHRLNMVQRESQYAYIYNCIRQVLKNPYFLKTYKPPPIDPLYAKTKTKKERSDSSTDLVDSLDTLRKNSLSTSADSMQPLCQSSPQTTPKIQMNGLRYCKSTSAIDMKSNPNRIGRYNSEGYAICESARDSFSTTSKESIDERDLKSSSSSLYENVEPLIRQSSSQTIAGSSYYLTNDAVEKDTSL